MVIRKGIVNTCVFSLAEKTTLDQVIYLFEFINSQDRTKKYFLAEDISINKISYNEFLIEETETEDLLNGKISLSLKGDYTYNIYEQLSTTNLDPTGLNIVKSDRIDVKGDAVIDAVFETTNNTVVFNG